MKPILVLALLVAAGPCSPPEHLTATVSSVATTAAKVGDTVQLVVKVANTGPAIPHLGLVFRTPDRWYEENQVQDLSGCSVSAAESAFDCGDLAAGDSRTFSFACVARAPGSFHYELALRELVQPFDWVNDHADGADAEAWEETVT